MTTPPIRMRRHHIVNGWYRKTGWRWTCLICPPVRGRSRGGFHHDHRFTDWRQPGRHPNAWTRCMRAAVCHIHAHHREPTRPMSTYPTVTRDATGPLDALDALDIAPSG